MKKTYTINLIPDSKKFEPFEILDENLVEVRIQIPGEKLLKSKGYSVELAFSVDGMLGLGTELIRKALIIKERDSNKRNFFEHLRPMDKSLVSKNMGVYLTPESAELMLAVKDFGKVEDIINKLKSEET